MWTIKDFTKAKGGYLQLQQDGERVCDFFPFAKDASEQIIRAKAKYICDVLNDGISAETERCAQIARSMGDDHIAFAICSQAVMTPTDTGIMT